LNLLTGLQICVSSILNGSENRLTGANNGFEAYLARGLPFHTLIALPGVIEPVAGTP
jgi:hypothetical protein